MNIIIAGAAIRMLEEVEPLCYNVGYESLTGSGVMSKVINIKYANGEIAILFENDECNVYIGAKIFLYGRLDRKEQ